MVAGPQSARLCFVLFVFVSLLVQHGLDFDGQAKEVDKALCVMLVVNVVFPKGGDFLAVEGIGRADAGVDDIALIEL